MTKVWGIGPVKILFGKLSFYLYCSTLLIKDERTRLVDPGCEEKALRAFMATKKIDFFFKTHYSQAWYLFERTMVQEHLDRFQRQAKISREGDPYKRES